MTQMADPTDQLADMLQAYTCSPHENPIQERTLIQRIAAVNDGVKLSKEVQKTTFKNENILHVAARKGDVHIITNIIKAMRGESRVSCVSQKKHPSVWDTLKVLFGAKAKCNTVLHVAVRRWRTNGRESVDAVLFDCDLSAAEILLLLNATDEKGRTPAEVAMSSKKVEQDKKERMENTLKNAAQAASENITRQGAETDRHARLNNDLKRERDQLKTERDQLKIVNDRLQKDKDDLQKDVKNLILERDNLKAHVDKMRQEFQGEVDNLRSENAALRQENARERNRMSQDIINLRSDMDGKISSMSKDWEEKLKSMLPTMEKNMIGTDQTRTAVNNYPTHSSNNISMSHPSSDAAHRSFITHHVVAMPVEETID